MTDLIKYYGNNDLSDIIASSKVEQKSIHFLENGVTEYKLEDYLEYANILKFLKSDIVFENISAKNRDTIIKYLKKEISTFFNKIPILELGEELQKTHRLYLNDFLEQFCIYKLGDKIDEITFENIVNINSISINYLLRHKYIVEKYRKFIKLKILSDFKNIEVLMQSIDKKNNKLFFIPDNISSIEWEKIIGEYIESEDVNLSYLYILKNNISIPKWPIKTTAITRQKAIKRITEVEDAFFSEKQNDIKTINFSVFSDKRDYDKELKKNSSSFLGLVDEKQILNYRNIDSISNYLKNELGLFNQNHVSVLPFKKNIDIGLFEDFFSVQTSEMYGVGLNFSIREHFNLAKLKMFQQILETKMNLQLEEIIIWNMECFEKKYGLQFLPLEFISPSEKMINRNSKIFNIEENIRKQYFLWNENNVIDVELFNLISTPKISELKSKLDKKYVYLNRNTINEWIQRQLFSSQSEINYVNPEKKAENFFNLMIDDNFDVKKEDFLTVDRMVITELIKKEILTEESRTGILKFKNIQEINILRYIYYQEVISYYHTNTSDKSTIDGLIEKGFLITNNTLFSKIEIDYINFVLNTGDWDNGYGLRNSYQHGGKYHIEDRDYESDYLLGILIIIFYIVKIEDELRICSIMNL